MYTLFSHVNLDRVRDGRDVKKQSISNGHHTVIREVGLSINENTVIAMFVCYVQKTKIIFRKIITFVQSIFSHRFQVRKVLKQFK